MRVGRKPYGAEVSPDERLVLSGDMESSTVTVVEPRSGRIAGVVTGTRGPRQAISWRADSRVAWVLNEDLTVAEVDVPGLRVTRTLGRR